MAKLRSEHGSGDIVPDGLWSQTRELRDMEEPVERYTPCVGSGMCCKKVPCGYGEWNANRTQCRYLEEAYSVVDGVDGQPTSIYRCGRYEYIAQQPGAEWMPAFGAGCCMSLFNDNRQRVIRLVVQGDERAQEILKPNPKPRPA